MKNQTTIEEEKIMMVATTGITLCTAKVVSEPTEENCNRLKKHLADFTEFITEFNKRKNGK